MVQRSLILMILTLKLYMRLVKALDINTVERLW